MDDQEVIMDYRNAPDIIYGTLNSINSLVLPELTDAVQQNYFNRVAWKIEEAYFLMKMLAENIQEQKESGN